MKLLLTVRRLVSRNEDVQTRVPLFVIWYEIICDITYDGDDYDFGFFLSF